METMSLTKCADLTDTRISKWARALQSSANSGVLSAEADAIMSRLELAVLNDLNPAERFEFAALLTRCVWAHGEIAPRALKILRELRTLMAEVAAEIALDDASTGGQAPIELLAE